MTATTLRAAMEQALDGSLPGQQLLRHFMAHEDWLVPVYIDADNKPHMVYVKDKDGQRFLLLYTSEQDYQAGVAAIGADKMGERTLRMAGHALFLNLPDDADVISINWGSPPEVFFKRPQLETLRRWARAVNVEKTLATPTPNLSLLKHFDAFYVVLQKIEGGYGLTLAPDQLKRKIATVFTAEDTADAFVHDKNAVPLGFEPIIRTVPGELLFDDLKDLGLDGIAFNFSGPVPRRMFTSALATAVMAAP